MAARVFVGSETGGREHSTITVGRQAAETPVPGAGEVHRPRDLRRPCSDLAARWLGAPHDPRRSAGNRHFRRHLYDYFPNKLALLSGYVRHSVEVLVEAVDREAVQPDELSWRQRVHQLVRLMCGVDAPELPWFHPQMLALEAQMAQPKHHRRVQEELEAAWQRVFDACADLPQRPSVETVRALHLAVWGGRRYALLLELDEAQARLWAAEMERMCCAFIDR
jgi:AcrR family transcriptional regulator